MIWDLVRVGTGPVELGAHEGGALAIAVLPDGRVITGGNAYDVGRVLIWDPVRADSAPMDLGTHDGGIGGMEVLLDGRVVIASDVAVSTDGQVLVYDPSGRRPTARIVGETVKFVGRTTHKIGFVAVHDQGDLTGFACSETKPAGQVVHGR